MNQKKTRPYWLEGGEETCEVCGHTMVIQAEIRCTGCDAGVCEHCSVTIHETHEIVCVPCARPAERG